MHLFKDTSTGHHTQLAATAKVGRRRERVSVVVPGRDVWAYQFAKIELQNRYLLALKRLQLASRQTEPRT